MLAAFERVVGVPGLEPSASFVHRWGLARAPEPLAVGALFDAEARLGLGGDWAAGGRVEGAFTSGLALAERALAAVS